MTWPQMVSFLVPILEEKLPPEVPAGLLFRDYAASTGHWTLVVETFQGQTSGV